MTFSKRAAICVRSALAAAGLIVLFVLLILSKASAEDTRRQAKEACRSDYSRFCSGLIPGGGRIRQCLNDHQAELSTVCRAALDANPPRQK